MPDLDETTTITWTASTPFLSAADIAADILDTITDTKSETSKFKVGDVVECYSAQGVDGRCLAGMPGTIIHIGRSAVSLEYKDHPKYGTFQWKVPTKTIRLFDPRPADDQDGWV